MGFYYWQWKPFSRMSALYFLILEKGGKIVMIDDHTFYLRFDNGLATLTEWNINKTGLGWNISKVGLGIK